MPSPLTESKLMAREALSFQEELNDVFQGGPLDKLPSKYLWLYPHRFLLSATWIKGGSYFSSGS